MCSLQEHSQRDNRLTEAKRGEPIYARLAEEHGLEYQPPATEN